MGSFPGAAVVFGFRDRESVSVAKEYCSEKQFQLDLKVSWWLFDRVNADTVSPMSDSSPGSAETAPTLASLLGTTVHLSPLLKKAERLGLSLPQDLERLAIQRGCRYYAQAADSLRVAEEPPETGGVYTQGRLPEIDETRFSPAELAIALLSICLPKSQHRLRIGACMLSAPTVEVDQVVHLAKQERAEAVVRYIATCGNSVEPEEPFWRELLAGIPEIEAKPDILPHITRFVAMTGITRRGVETVMQWIRPISPQRKEAASA